MLNVRRIYGACLSLVWCAPPFSFSTFKEFESSKIFTFQGVVTFTACLVQLKIDLLRRKCNGNCFHFHSVESSEVEFEEFLKKKTESLIFYYEI